jgi:hypothetical protein
VRISPHKPQMSIALSATTEQANPKQVGRTAAQGARGAGPLNDIVGSTLARHADRADTPGAAPHDRHRSCRLDTHTAWIFPSSRRCRSPPGVPMSERRWSLCR